MGSEKKLTIGLLCGGRSGEHTVSLASAMNIQKSLNREKYNIALIGIEKNGTWHLSWEEDLIHHPDDIQKISLNLSKPIVYLDLNGEIKDQTTHKILTTIDVFFPITHGVYGEDGTLQGYLRWLDVPFVGPGITGSSICMDKDVTKRLLRDSGLPITPFISVRASQTITFEEASVHLGIPLFIKPCHQGSSLGVTKVSDQETFNQAIKKAFRYSRKILIEQSVKAKEIECSVLGNSDPSASKALGEIAPLQEFYSFDAKYVSDDGAKLDIPADLEEETVQKIRQAAISAYTILECEGMARIDFFVKPDGSFLINEVNTLPGFTNISMYPKLWESSDLPQSELLDKLITLAIERYQQEKQLKI